MNPAASTSSSSTTITSLITSWIQSNNDNTNSREKFMEIFDLSIVEENLPILIQLGAIHKVISLIKLNSKDKFYVDELLAFLANITCETTNGSNLYHNVELMDIAIQYASTGNENALQILANLTVCDDIRETMFQNTRIIDIAKKYGNEKGSECALMLLGNLALEPSVVRVMVKDLELVKIAVKQTRKGNSMGLHLLQSLARYEDTSVIIFQQCDKKLIQVLTSHVELGDTSAFSIVQSFTNIASVGESLVRDYPYIVEFLIQNLDTYPDGVLLILQNLSNRSKTVFALDTPSVIGPISKYLNSKEDNWRLISTMILANVIGHDRERSEMLLIKNLAILKYLVQLFNHVLTKPIEEKFAGISGWALHEPLQPIRSLSFVDRNRTVLVAEGILPLLTSALSKSFMKQNIECCLCALEALHEYVFDEIPIPILCQDDQLRKTINEILKFDYSSSTSNNSINQWEDVKMCAQYLKLKLKF
jgi:hypothetical protein